MFERFGKTDFFNRIGRFQPVTTGRERPKTDIGKLPLSAGFCLSPRATTEQKKSSAVSITLQLAKTLRS
jgi:hypothetical protein